MAAAEASALELADKSREPEASPPASPRPVKTLALPPPPPPPRWNAQWDDAIIGGRPIAPNTTRYLLLVRHGQVRSPEASKGHCVHA